MTLIDTRNLILILVAALNSILGLVIFIKNRKDPVNLWYGLTALSTSLWAIGIAFFRLATDLTLADFWARFYYASAALIGASFMLFSFYFPFSIFKVKKVHKICFIVFSLAVLVVSLYPDVLVGQLFVRDWGKEVKLSDFYIIFSSYFLMCLVGAFGNLILKIKKATTLQKIQIKFVFVGTMIAAIWGVTFNLLLPFFGNYKLIWLGPYFTLFMVGFIAYAVVRHQLMNIKVIATEIFAILIPLALFVDVFFLSTNNERIFKFWLFLFVAFFSLLLVRSVLKEIRSKERLEKLTNSLHRANLELQKLDKAKSDFISIASHQLRTPLTVIKGFVSMMLEGSFGQINDVMRDKLNKTYESAERLIKLVNDLLDLSHMEGGKMRYEFKKVELAAMVQSVFEELAPQAARKNLKFEFNRPAGEFNVWADEEKLRQVAMNLIDNAIKYTKEGGVVLSLVDTGGQIEFSVKDTGLGMSPQEIPKLFQKFVRGTTAPRMYTDGSGIGLYVAKKVMDEHRGQIGAQSAGAGQGSTFFIKMPEYKDGMAPPVVAEAPTSQVPAAK